MIGYCMTTSVKHQKAFILYGETASNGKSTLVNYITKLIGNTNVSNVSFKDMNINQFATSSINGKLLNIGAEMTDDALKDVSIFKMYISGDPVEMERKFRDRVTVSPYAKFIFNANTLPIVDDKTDGFYRRLQIIPLEKSFSREEAEHFKFSELITEKALKYLAKIAVKAYSAVDIYFSNYKESDIEVAKYKINANSILSYSNDKEQLNTLIQSLDGVNKKLKIVKGTDLYNNYVQYCKDNQYHKIEGRNNFYKYIEKLERFIPKMKDNQKFFIISI